MTRLGRIVLPLVAAATGAVAPAAAAQAPPAQPAVGHVLTIVLESEDYADTFGRHTKAPYLARTLRRKGTLLPAYFGTAHKSLPNHLTMISGQPSTAKTRADCPRFDCAYDAGVQTLPDQLEAAGRPWRGYFQDLPAPCTVPQEGIGDPFVHASKRSQYATRHNPFVYFRSITDDREACRRQVVGLRRLRADLKAVGTTPAWSFIAPDLCANGHDRRCANPRQRGGYRGIEGFLKRWVPRILRSPAFERDGLLVITFDEAEDDAERGGGRIGALLIGPAVPRGETRRTALDHYSYLRSMEDLFGLPHLAGAADPDVATFQSAGVFEGD